METLSWGWSITLHQKLIIGDVWISYNPSVLHTIFIQDKIEPSVTYSVQSHPWTVWTVGKNAGSVPGYRLVWMYKAASPTEKWVVCVGGISLGLFTKLNGENIAVPFILSDWLFYLLYVKRWLLMMNQGEYCSLPGKHIFDEGNLDHNSWC